MQRWRVKSAQHRALNGERLKDGRAKPLRCEAGLTPRGDFLSAVSTPSPLAPRPVLP